MKIYLMIGFVLLSFVQIQGQCRKQNSEKTKKETIMTKGNVVFKDLPAGIKLKDKVRVNKFNDEGVIVSFELITVEKKLREIGAKYVERKLVDKNGREIRFYKPPVRGASQGFEEDQKQQKRDALELAELKAKFTVVEIYVNPLKAM